MSSLRLVRLMLVAILVLGSAPGTVLAQSNKIKGSTVSGAKEKLESKSGKKLKTNHSTVRNDNMYPIFVVWTAAGCVGIKYYHTEACSSAELQPGESASYHYRWGATNDNIHVGMRITDTKSGDHYDVVTGSYLPGQVLTVTGNCKIHSPDGGTVSVKNVGVYGWIEINCDISVVGDDEISNEVQ